MNNSPVIFANNHFGESRFIREGDSFVVVAKDVIEGVGNVWKGDAGSIAHVPEQWKRVCSVQTPRGTQDILCLTEEGLYFYLGRCDKPAALQYQMWIAGEVVPAIRKHGGYLTPAAIEEALTDPDTIIRLATTLKDERRKRIALESQVATDRPKVIFADAVAGSSTSILVGVMAKILRQNGVNIGQNRLFQWLRDNSYLISRPGESWNMPTQWAMDRGFFEVKERVVCNPDGSNRTTRTPMITGTGQVRIVNAFTNPKEAAA